MLLEQLSQQIIGAFYDVYNALGYRYLEATYQRALVVALQHRGLRTSTEVPIQIQYMGVNVGDYRLDLVVNEAIVVECKRVEKIAPTHRAQVIHYLHASRYPLGLLFNFGPEPRFERFIQTRRR